MPYKILLIDDSMTQLEMLKLQLMKAGFEVETAKDGNEGYRRVFETAPDLVLSDVMMPILNGYQLCRLLKNNPVTQKIPIILLTVLQRKMDKFWGNKSGANKFISKTTNYSEVEQSVKEIIEQNPVSDEDKQVILDNVVSEEVIQNQVNSVLDELLMNSTFLNEFRDLGEFLSHEEVLVEKTFSLLGSFVDYNVAGLFLTPPDKNEKNILHLDIQKNSVSSFVIEKIKREFFSQMPDLPEFTISDFGHNIVRESVESPETIFNTEEFKTVHIVPLIANQNLVGGICFFNKEEFDYTTSKFYKTMVNEILLLLKMNYLYAETEHLSVTDGLTGLYNRRHFEYNLEREFLRTKRYPSDLSLAMIDVDHFKEVNDTYGHQFGDYALKKISSIIVDSFRKTDMIYRYGGEELAVILPETPLDGAVIPLERLRQKISEYNFSYNNQEAHITVSVGASFNFEGIKSQTELVECADKALYNAKQNGRNKVVAYSNEKFNNVIQ